MHRFAAKALVLAIWATIGVAHAQPGDAQNTAAARAMFEEGMSAVDARQWERAVDLLRRSVELRDSPVVRFNLGLALIELGHFVEASEHLRAVQRASPAGSDAHRLAGERLAAIQGRAGRLRVDVTGAADSVEVRLDGRAVPAALIGAPQPADPGERRVSLHRGGAELAASTVTVESGQLAVVTLDAPPPLPVAADPLGRDVAPSGGVEREWWFWTLIAVLVVGAGVGIGLAVWASEPQQFLVGDDGITHMTLVEFP